MWIVAESHLIGLPFALIGLGIMLAHRPLGDFYAGMGRKQARFADKLPGFIAWYFRIGTKSAAKDVDNWWSWLNRYGLLLIVGFSFVVAGIAAVAGLWNPYE